MNNSLTPVTLDLNIEVLDHRVELLAAAAGTCSTTSCTTCSSEPEVPSETVIVE